MADLATEELSLQIGSKVKALRTARGLSGRKLATAAGVSQPFLSQLESGRTSVAIATLYRIADALGVSPADLLPSRPDAEIEVLRAPEIHRMTVSERAGAAGASAVFRQGRTISELLDYTIEPGESVDEWFDTDGEYVTYMIEGSIRVEFEGHPDVQLDPGDVLSYSGPVRSRWHPVGRARARVILIAAGAMIEPGSQPSEEPES